MPVDPPEGYYWTQPDAMELRCEACGDTVQAGVVDLHARTCSSAP